MSKIFKNGRVVAGSNYYKDLLGKPTINGHALEEINNTSKSLEIFQAVTKTDFEDPSFVRNPQCVYAVFEEDSLGRTNVRFHFSNQLEATDPDYKEYIANDYKPVLELPSSADALKEQIYFLTEGWVDPITNLKYGIGLYGWMIVDDTTDPPTYGWRTLTEVPIDNKTIFLSEDGNISSQVGGYHDTDATTIKTQSTELITREEALTVLQDDEHTSVTFPYTEYEQYTPRTQYTTSLFYQGSVIPVSKSTIPTNLTGNDYIQFNQNKTITIILDKTSYPSVTTTDYVLTLTWDKPLEESISYINPIYIPVNDSIVIEDGKLGVASAKNAYTSIHKIDDYLYEVDYSGVNYFDAKEYFAEMNPSYSSCASFKNGLYFGYNHDSIYNEEATFVVSTPTRTSRYATMSVCTGIPELTKKFVETGAYSKLYSVLPHMVKSGVNVKGLVASTHTVLLPPGATATTVTAPDVEEEKRFCALQLARYVLDRFESAKEAAEYIRDYVAVYMPKNFQDEGYEVSIVIADSTKIYSIEFIDNKNEIREISSSPIYTNYYKSLTTINTDGSLYGPKDVPTHTPSVENTLKANSQGIERHNSLNADYDPTSLFSSPVQMRTTLSKILYTKVYDLTNEFYTDYTGVGSLTVDSPAADYTGSADVAAIIAKYTARSRDPEDANYGTKHTSHSSVFDIKSLKLYLTSQEGTTNYEFALPLEDDGDEDYIIGPISDTAIDASQNAVLQQILNDIFNSNKTLIVNYNNEDHLMTSSEEKVDDSGHYLSFASVLNRTYTMIKVYYNNTDKIIIGARRYKVYPIQYSLTDVGEGSFLPTGNIMAICDDYRRITITAVEGFKVSLVNGWKGDGTVEYSFDRENWTEWDGTGAIEVTELNPYSLYEINFRGVGNNYISTETEQTQFKFTTLDDKETRDIGLEVKNNPIYLLDYELNTIVDSTDLFNSLFKDCKLISRANGIVLPYISIGIRSYKDMFSGCSRVTIGPTLPAETLMEESCSGMFRNCTSLVSPPSLAPTEMAKACYKEMFMGCSSLVFPSIATPYTLPADKLAESCYESMFKGCGSITYAPALEGGAIFGVPDRAYANMFENCTGLTVGPSTLSAITIGNHAYDSMFKGCSSLVTAVNVIPATNIGEYAMASMFEDCILLEVHPKLEVTLLTRYACQAMFKNCKALKDPTYIAKFAVLDDHSCTEMYMNCISIMYPIFIEEDAVFNGTLPITDNMYKNCTKIVWYNAGHPYKINVPDDRFDDMFTGTNYRDSISQICKDNINYYYLRPKTENCLLIKPNDMTNASAFNITFNTGFVRKNFIPDPSYGHIYYTILPNDEPVWEHVTDSVVSVEADKYIAVCCNLRKTNGVNLIKLVDTDIKIEGSLDGFASVPTKTADPGAEYDVYTFENLFANCDKLISAMDLKYNEKLLKVGMYKSLFEGSGIVIAPNEEFNYTETNEIYMSMFKNCTSLTTIPTFNSSNNIGKQSCYEMFMGTTVLTTVPFSKIGYDTIDEEGCLSMFEFSGLTSVLELPNKNLNKGCYKRMFAGSEVNSFLSNSKILSNIYKIPEEGCMEMFKECTKLTYVSDEFLEGITICDKYGCYNMFADCASLIRSPNIHFDEINEYGCGGMYKNCTALTNTPTSINVGIVNEKGCFEMYYNTGITESLAVNIETANGGGVLASIFEECKELESAREINIVTNRSEKLLSRAFYKCVKLINTPTITNTTITDYCYEYMFYGCTSLTGVPFLLLPVTKVGKYSYSYMFHSCTSLTAPPQLPATTLDEFCYRNMFTGCTSLTTATTLPAIEVVKGCYWSMFMNCTSLVYPPALPAITLAESCYRNMFNNCTSLIETPDLLATTLANNCYEEMFSGCTRLVYPTILSTEIMANYCYQRMFSGCSGITWYSTGAEYRLPSEGTGVTATDWSNNMFVGNSGASIPVTPVINTSYYYIINTEFTFETISNDAIVKNTTVFTLKYSIDNGTTWVDLAVGASTPAAGKVIVKGPIVSEYNDTQADNKGLYVTGTNVKVSGSIPKKMKYSGLFAHSPGLKDASGLIFYNHKLTDGCYSAMFRGCSSLTTAPALPATQLAANCYSAMFRGCSSLTTAPALPAITLFEACYKNMFVYCTSLTTPPTLPATTLAKSCYSQMFWNCTSLTTAPILPAMTATPYCYEYMFCKCTSLTTPPALPATTVSEHCYQYMFRDCTSLTKTVDELPATVMAPWCYWSIFEGCSAITSIPDNFLHSNSLAEGCYRGVFYKCTGLSEPCKLPATVMAPTCYYDMFAYCSGIVWDTAGTPYRLPSEGTGTTATDWSTNMFNGNSGTSVPVSPSINTTYYYIPETILTFESRNSNANDVVIKNNLTVALKYSINNGTTWENLVVGGSTPARSKVMIKGKINQRTAASTSYTLGVAGTNVAVSGQLQDGVNYKYLFYGQTALKYADGLIGGMKLSQNSYLDMFKGCTGLKTPPTLPATNLPQGCYMDMFYNCNSLTTAPQLPATTVSYQAYDQMFRNCTSLTTPPELPATTLNNYCYSYMFAGCNSLITAPELPATVMAPWCYYGMFEDCSALIATPPRLPAENLAQSCYKNMFRRCTTIKITPQLPATTLYIECYAQMFAGCTGLTAPATLRATTMAVNCYLSMFSGCTGIVWGTAGTPYRLPTEGTGTTATDWSTNMFSGNSGSSVPTSPAINTTYYYLPDYITLTFENELSSVRDVVIKPNIAYPSLQYSIDSGATWINLSSGTSTPPTHKTMIRGYIYGIYSTTGFTVTGTNVKVSGELGKNSNYTYLFRDSSGISDASDLIFPIEKANDYFGMFKNCVSLKTAPTLSSMVLTRVCYRQMFMGCTSLTTVPTLPAEILDISCYDEMFRGCTSLTVAPRLTTTNLAPFCYSYTFADCTSLVDPPELPATTLKPYCYYGLFYNCSSLKIAPQLPAMNLDHHCYCTMFQGCTKLESAPELPATTLYEGCYQAMFLGCTSLTVPSKLIAQTMASHCYYAMFQDCSGITWASVGTSYRLPYSGSGTTATNWNNDMFKNNSGSSIPTSPSINTTYYYLPVTTLDFVDTMATNASSDMVIVNNLARSIEYMRDDNGVWQTLASGASTEGQTIINKITVKGRLFGESESTSLKITAKSGKDAAVKVSGNLGKEAAYDYLFYGSDKLTDASDLIFPEENGRYKYMFCNCVSLATAPELPATVLLYTYSYAHMFQNCTSLTTAPELPATTLQWGSYEYMFEGCTSLATPPTELPSTTLANYCYHCMFVNCSALTTAPTLPATTLISHCYHSMFDCCKALTTAPELPATTLAENCYADMFGGCTKLTTAPKLPATTLTGNSCYAYMFANCTSLTTPPELPARNTTQWCYDSMFAGCSSLTSVPELPVTTLEWCCYSRMFENCTSITKPCKLPATDMPGWCYFSMFSNCDITWSSSGIPYRLPSSGTGTTTGEGWSNNMFKGNNGLSIPETPAINTTYYYMDKTIFTFTSNTSAVGLTNNLGYSIKYAITDIGVEPTTWTNLDNGSTVSSDINKLLTIKAGIFVSEANKLVVTGTNVKLGGKLTAEGKYNSLFKGCTALTDVSALIFPSDLTVDGYAKDMFMNCTNIVNAEINLSNGTLSHSCFHQMFMGCSNLITPPRFPSKNLASECYRDTFKNCTKLAVSPELPATTLAHACYEGLFYNTAIEEPPYLPALSTVQECYCYMFTDCVNLKTAPDLPSNNIAIYAYRFMFRGCTSLEETPEILATIIDKYGCAEMFQNCTSLKKSRGNILAKSFNEYSCAYMFDGCTLLTTPPIFTINSVGVSSFEGAFRNCTSIEIPNAINITSAATNCFKEMYRGCTGIIWSGSGAEYRIPTKGSISQAASTFMTDMFTGCSGSPIPTNKEVVYYCNGIKTTIKLEGSDFKVKNLLGHRVYYRYNSSEEWAVIGDGSSVSFTQPVYIKGDLCGYYTATDTFSLIITGNTVDVKVSGDLLEKVSYKYAFAGSTGIIDISGLNFPEEAGSYRGMFKDCINLVTTPLSLPALDNLPEYVYANMFQGCTSLIQCPTINARVLSDSCCESMYEGCISVTNPIVPNPTSSLKTSCYKNMFKGCTSITTPTNLPAANIPNYAYEGMFQDCIKINWTTVGVPYRLPSSSSTGTIGTDSFKNMFANNSGILPGSIGTPVVNTTYYYSGPMTTLEFNGTDVEITNNSKLSLQYTIGTSAWITLAPGGKTSTASKIKVRGYFEPNSNKCLLVNGTNVSVSGSLQPNQDYRYLFIGSTGITDASGLIFPMKCGVYENMFQNCTGLKTPPELPAKNLVNYCYRYMFLGCSALESAPELPATILTYACHYGMFEGCKALTTPPELPATTLAGRCYERMFNGCTSLTIPPTLPATQLTDYCYGGMFEDCTALTRCPELPATTLATGCYQYMFSGCTKLNRIPNLPARILPKYCYRYMFYRCNEFTWGAGTRFVISADSVGTNWNTGMFNDNSGTLPGGGSPSINTNYYYGNSNTPNITLTFTGSNITIRNNTIYTIKYRKDGGSWIQLTKGSITPNATSKLEINGNIISDNAAGKGLEVFGLNVKVSGNLIGDMDYGYLFAGSTGITDASGLIFPEKCGIYRYMFSGCTSLKTPPTLSTTQLVAACYQYMFYNCTSLTTPPALPATIMVDSCYEGMFRNCVSLKELPNLTVIKLAPYCYQSMFRDCRFIWTKAATPYKFKINYTSEETTLPISWNSLMFGNNNGYLPEGGGSPKVNVEYYLNKDMAENCIEFTSIDRSGKIYLKNNHIRDSYIYYDQDLILCSIAPGQTSVNYDTVYIETAEIKGVYRLEIKCTTNTMKVSGKLNKAADIFKRNTTLKDAGGLIIDTGTYCGDMFRDCTSLTTPPQLPATTLGNHCYECMFAGCSSLTTPPQLPATTLADYCYRAMFMDCTSLIALPILPATHLTRMCYAQMFRNCSRIIWTTDTSAIPYRLPASGTGTTEAESYWNVYTFFGNSGTLPGTEAKPYSLPGTPSINTTYYYHT